MEENKFERQVQQKMDELRIHPSDSVWEKIEVRIEKKKRSNRGILLFTLLLFAFFAFLTGGYMLWNNRQHSIKEANTSEKTRSEKNSNDILIKDNNTSQPENNSIANSTNHDNNVAGNAPVKDSEINKNNNKNSSHHTQPSIAKRTMTLNSGGKATIQRPKQQEANNEVSENPEAKPGVVAHSEMQVENEKITAEAKKDPAYDAVNKDSVSKPVLVLNEKASVKDTLQKISASSQTVKHSKKNKWRPGVLFSAGISRVGNDFLGFANSSPLDYLNNSNGQGTTPGNTQGSTGMVPSKTRSAFGFVAGVFAEKNISRKVILVTGINFRSFNTSTKVGARNDTTRNFTARNAFNKYDGYYNFIELPVTLKVKIGNGAKMPWFWQGGLVVSQLISTNALQYNQNSGWYYVDNSIFNKTQIGLKTAFSASLFSKQKNSVLIGPYFYYSASSLANEGLYNKRHFVFTGLRAEIIFGK